MKILIIINKIKELTVMNYKKIYESLVEQGKSRILESYGEIHHIIPRCMGGTDDNFNLVKLTPEEHYVAHQLLIKIYPDNHKLAKAAAMMIPNRRSNKMYGWVRRKFSAAQSIDQSGIKNSQYGTKWAHNPLTKENKKIKGKIEDGWNAGKYKNPIIKSPSFREKNKEEQIRIHSEYYELYKKYGFDEFVKITNYKFSKQNLVQQFAKLLPEFAPQNGKKR